MKSDSSIQAIEARASETIFPELQEHLNYVNDAYILAFKVQEAMGDKRITDISNEARAQFMILMRITDFLRCIQLLTVKGYPEQACTLAASVFELAHTAAMFCHSPGKAEAWLEAESVKQQMPRSVTGGTWKDLVKANCECLGDGLRAESEYQVYQQLCWMKHSLPKMQDMRVEEDTVKLVVGPHTDERALSHAWFALEHSGMLTELVISLLIPDFGTEETKGKLQVIGEQRARLFQKAVERFGRKDPF